jgi:hypothetical protein
MWSSPLMLDTSVPGRLSEATGQRCGKFHEHDEKFKKFLKVLKKMKIIGACERVFSLNVTR